MKTTVKINANELKDAIRKEYIGGRITGRHWHFVRVWPDGHISHGSEASPCYPESEYYRKGNPPPVTVWSQTFSEAAGPGDGEFDWIECPEDEAEFWVNRAMDDYRRDRDEEFPIPCRLADTMIDDLDWEMILPDVELAMSEAGYELAD